jgi:Phage gp6-like head-tail connector protein
MHQILKILDESTDSAGPDLISLDDLKFALGITDASEDAQLQAAITMQSRLIADYCNRRFGRAEALETFTFDRGESLQPRQALVLSLYPISEIFEISALGATAGDYDFDPASGRVWTTAGDWMLGYPYPGSWWRGTISVTYSGGYDLPEQSPARLQQAVIQAVNDGRTTGARDPGIREVQYGDIRIGYFTPALSTGSSGYLSTVVTDLIQPYRRLYVA